MAEPLRKPEIKFELLIENNESFNRALDRARGAMTDLTLPLTQIGLMLFKSQRSIFNLKGPGLYQDLSRDYKIEKAKTFGFVYPILKATGRLEKSTTERSHPDAVMDIVNRDTLYWGTRVEYARKHQEGIGVPKRPVLIWGSESRFNPDLAGSRIGRALNILNYHALRALGKDIGPTGGES